ncbi:hypothetical protein TRFO_02645 [Tritrichomonas foetus]|uniref:Uncharacterized protein n=1 Tax=Tritrichomonas foetus TaxID=1144522 RepID=A0A1J4L376_9EUKA|nr:hypothetical protein TRFO_02645 [Tritrichomonas foetus]|eukprot:OHT16406.1 hypothetical protein TRFO_02645 [Tritrichomonas foetus]
MNHPFSNTERQQHINVKLKDILHSSLIFCEKKLMNSIGNLNFRQKHVLLAALIESRILIGKIYMIFRLESEILENEKSIVENSQKNFINSIKNLLENIYNEIQSFQAKIKSKKINEFTFKETKSFNMKPSFSFHNQIFKNYGQLNSFNNRDLKKVVFSKFRIIFIYPNFTISFKSNSKGSISWQSLNLKLPLNSKQIKKKFNNKVNENLLKISLSKIKLNKSQTFPNIKQISASIDSFFFWWKFLVIDMEITKYSKDYSFMKTIKEDSIKYTFSNFFEPYNELILTIYKNNHIILKSTSLSFQPPQGKYEEYFSPTDFNPNFGSLSHQNHSHSHQNSSYLSQNYSYSNQNYSQYPFQSQMNPDKNANIRHDQQNESYSHDNFRKYNKENYFWEIVHDSANIEDLIKNFKKRILFTKLRNLFVFLKRIIKTTELRRLILKMVCDNSEMWIELISYMWGNFKIVIDNDTGKILVNNIFGQNLAKSLEKILNKKEIEEFSILETFSIRRGLLMGLKILLGPHFQNFSQNLTNEQFYDTENNDILHKSSEITSDDEENDSPKDTSNTLSNILTNISPNNSTYASNETLSNLSAGKRYYMDYYIVLSYSDYFYLNVNMFDGHPSFTMKTRDKNEIPLNNIIRMETNNVPFFIGAIVRSLYSLKFHVILKEIEKNLLQIGCHCLIKTLSMQIIFPTNLTATLKLKINGCWSLTFNKGNLFFSSPGEFVLYGNEVTARFSLRIVKFIKSIRNIVNLQWQARCISGFHYAQFNDLNVLLGTKHNHHVFIGMSKLKCQKVNEFKRIYHVHVNTPPIVISSLSKNIPIQFSSSFHKSLGSLPLKSFLTNYVSVLANFYTVFKSDNWDLNAMSHKESFTCVYKVTNFTMSVCLMQNGAVSVALPSMLPSCLYKAVLLKFPLFIKSRKLNYFVIRIAERNFPLLKQLIEDYSPRVLQIMKLSSNFSQSQIENIENGVRLMWEKSSSLSIDITSVGISIYPLEINSQNQNLLNEKLFDCLNHIYEIDFILHQEIGQILSKLNKCEFKNEINWELLIMNLQNPQNNEMMIQLGDKFKVLIKYGLKPIRYDLELPQKLCDIAIEDLLENIA